MRAALAALDEARLNLERTTVRAPGQGYVGGLKIDEGTYVSAGQPAMTFIAIDDIWVEAYMTENQLSSMEYGNKVELAFDAYPGQIFEGKVKSAGAGVSMGKKADLGDLSTAQSTRAWLRDPQRFPVIIAITNYEFDVNRTGGLRLNSQADVIVYTGEHAFWNALGRTWIRLMSWLSYAY
jgi:multidrug resistance efflux pump